ncbi:MULTISPECIES: CU044_2847 family protein [unclassified Kitasatospora]|uniref:CU044_2847 family protein n=1 Tax=unclassified Kitasatospora TaxID=2633591 RepID=UPI000708CABC|nr:MULTISPECIES: CU044_2847 family protein [unclassified Kitasatospora]KQV20906.1 hypothetical protein ASC99_20595 [Kitasatospora sp. Root107]KRB60441.1 hypothetical protein ASE03_12590 [Kitasatospora sp. Root187]
MKHLVELPVGETTVKVEISVEDDGLVQVSRPERLARRAARSLGEMLADIRPVAEEFVTGLGSMTQRPDEVSLEFGLTMSAEADLVISSAAAEANFTVSMTWHPSRGDTEPTLPS